MGDDLFLQTRNGNDTFSLLPTIVAAKTLILAGGGKKQSP